LTAEATTATRPKTCGPLVFAREGADVVIAYLSQHDDASGTAQWVKDAGQRAVLFSGDLSDPQSCRALINKAVGELSGVDVLVSNAAYQMTPEPIAERPDEEWPPSCSASEASGSNSLAPG
jgi:NAD(P)-dependent dehydrogenase (short-subunit alcohol dehydrogenase family)